MSNDFLMPQETMKKRMPAGCGCTLCLVIPPLLLFLAMLSPYFFPALFTSTGEHLPIAEIYSPAAADYSFHDTYMNQVCEFSIPEQAFLEMCREKKWEPITVESLPELPPFSKKQSHPWKNYKRDIPRTIPRYVYPRPEHEHCDPWNFNDCCVDPTGKTTKCCFHSVTKGYYYEYRLGNGGGMQLLYDVDNGRCYIHSNHH